MRLRKKHPLIVAIEFHYKFVRIHPFDDGNGRMARLLMNFILMKYDYPPVIVLTQDKEAYIQALHEADQEDDFEPFAVFVAECLIQSQELMLKTAKGESIDDPEDLDKKIRLLQKRLEKQEEVREEKTLGTILQVIIRVFCSHFEEKIYTQTLDKFASLFSNNNIESTLTIGSNEHKLSLNNRKQLVEDVKGLLMTKSISKRISEVRFLSINYYLKGFKHAGIKTFNLKIEFRLKFLEYTYQFHYFISGNMINSLEKLYHQSISNEEVDQIAKEIADQTLLEIEQKNNLNKT